MFFTSHNRAAVLGFVAQFALAALAACAPTQDATHVTSTAPIAGTDCEGCGGKMDKTYREIYGPGEPRWYLQ